MYDVRAGERSSRKEAQLSTSRKETEQLKAEPMAKAEAARKQRPFEDRSLVRALNL